MIIDNIIVAYIVWEVEVSLSQTTFTARPTARHNRRIIIQLQSRRISQNSLNQHNPSCRPDHRQHFGAFELYGYRIVSYCNTPYMFSLLKHLNNISLNVSVLQLKQAQLTFMLLFIWTKNHVKSMCSFSFRHFHTRGNRDQTVAI